MKTNILLIFFFFFVFAHSQNFKINKIVLDRETKTPIEYAEVFNSENNCITDKSGSFIFITKKNEINIKKIGYENILMAITGINETDTIYMSPKLIQLDEVVVSDYKPLIKKVYSTVKDNYPLEPFSENFFLRCILKKDGKIIKIQDISGRVERNSLFRTQKTDKNSYKVEILNMRKAGLVAKSNQVEDFELYSFKELFDWISTIFTVPNEYNYIKEKNIDDENYLIHFNKNELNNNQLTRLGYYVINKNDHSIREVSYNTVFNNINDIPFLEKGDFKWRTINTELQVNFKANSELKKYYINNANLKNIVEVLKNNTSKNNYEASYDFFVTNNFIREKVNDNFSEVKDIFKANFKYSEDFWNNQSQLPLTKEIKDFLSNLSKTKSEPSEFKIIQNF